MSTIKIKFLLLIFISIPALLICATAQPNFPIAKPDCVDNCGDVNIPYPFGTTENCYRNSSFWVTCNQTSTPPQLYMWDSNVEIKEISLTGKLKVMQHIAKACYSPDGTLISSNRGNLQLPYLFTINNTENKFTVVGCDSYGYIIGRRWWDRYYSTGCIARCSRLEDMESGSCMGVGCCQMSRIPEDISSANVSVSSFDNHVNVSNISNCTYGFVVEETAFKFSPDNLTNLWSVDRLPVMVDWVIAKETCEVAQRNSSSYACVSHNSKCSELIPGEGYMCQCETGYEGNPYLSDGCKDINECDSADLNNCTLISMCSNIPGDFTCGCPKGYSGTGTGERGCYCPQGYHSDGEIIREGGCIRNEMGIYKPISGAALGVILVLLFSCLLHLVLKKRRSNKMKRLYFLQNGGILLQEKLNNRDQTMSTSVEMEMSSRNDTGKIFSSTELERATNNFHSSMIVGQGGFGTVYKGILDDHRIVAIKKSKEVDPSQIEQFINEVVVLSRINHRNVVKLIGCCLETPVPLLVYEFINNGTLYEHIHDPAKKRCVTWNLRVKIARETAEVLSYLHSAASIPIIHRDVKSANILLDHSFEAKVSDFGASRLVPIDQTQLSTMVQGTFGYLDPEYMQTNQLTEKSDVYSFGVVLLELLMGVKPLSYDRPEEERNLTSFFLRKLKQGRLIEVLDETIVSENVNLEQVTEVAKLAQACIHLKGQDRPSMKQVAMELEGLRTSGNVKHSWAKFEDNVEEIEPLRGDLLEGFANGDGYSTTVGFDSLRDEIKLSGGR